MLSTPRSFVWRTVVFMGKQLIPMSTYVPHFKPASLTAALLTALVSLLSAICYAEEWKYDDCYREELLYLHAVVNYEYDPDWSREWEKNLVKGSGLRFSFGSIARSQLLHREELVINQRLDDSWGFRSLVSWYGSRHLDEDDFSGYLEFQRALYSDVSMYISADVRHEKGEIDGSLGFMKADKSRENFLRIEACWDDLVYDDRNNNGGSSERFPLGIVWTARYGSGNWMLFADGKVSRGFDRIFSDPARSPDISRHEKQTNRAHFLVSRLLSARSRLEAELFLYRFDDNCSYRDAVRDYSYRNGISIGTLRCLFPLGDRYRMRIELSGVGQDSRTRRGMRCDYRRRELLPSVFAKRHMGHHAVEIGYFGSVYDWEYDDFIDSRDFDRNDYVDKMKIGWFYSFSKSSRIQLSLSHVVSMSSFGGGNAQYIVMF